MFLEISQNSPKNTCVRASFLIKEKKTKLFTFQEGLPHVFFKKKLKSFTIGGYGRQIGGYRRQIVSILVVTPQR